MSRLVRAADLPATDVSRQDFYDLVENAKPAADLVDGNTLEVSGDKLMAGMAVPQWRKFTVPYTVFSNSGNAQVGRTLFTTGPHAIVHGVAIKVPELFETPENNSIKLRVSGGGNVYFDEFSLHTVSAYKIDYYPVTHDNIVFLTSTSYSVSMQITLAPIMGSPQMVCSDLTQGEFELFFLYSEIK